MLPLFLGAIKIATGFRACVLWQGEHVRGPADVAERRSRGLLYQARHHIPHRRKKRERVRSGYSSQVVTRYEVLVILFLMC